MSRSNDIANITSSVLDGVTKAEVGLGNVDNTSDANKPVSTAQQSAIDLKANIASPTFTGTTNVSSGVTLPSNPTIALGSNATLPSGTLVSVHQTNMGSTISMTAGTSYHNNVNLNFQPKSATSKFIIIIGGRYTRSGNNSGAYIGYTMKNGSLNNADVTNVMATDSHYHGYRTVLFKAESGTGSVTWSVGDSLYFGTFFQSNTNSADMYEYNLTVFEYMP